MPSTSSRRRPSSRSLGPDRPFPFVRGAPPNPPTALSIHLWAHLWWERSRRDFSPAHEGWCTPSAIRRARTTFADLARPYLPESDSGTRGHLAAPPWAAAANWIYLSLDETSGYGVAADRCRTALEDFGVEVDWTPFVPGENWNLGYQPPTALDPFPLATEQAGQVVVAHLVPEYFPAVRQRCADAFLVGHTAWRQTVSRPLGQLPRYRRSGGGALPVQRPGHPLLAGLGSGGGGSPRGAPRVLAYVAPVGSHPTGRCRLLHRRRVERTKGRLPQHRGLPASVHGRRSGAARREDLAPRPALPPTAGRRVVEPGTSAWALSCLVANHRNPAPVQLVTRELSDDDLRALHERGDCFVSLCRSEGWGLGAFDAAAFGNRW